MAEEGVIQDTTQFDEGTLFRVYEALVDSGMGTANANRAITFMQNAGILFRERFAHQYEKCQFCKALIMPADKTAHRQSLHKDKLR